MESYMSYAGFAGSAISMLATFYFWLVRTRQERPCLKPYLADREMFLGQGRDNVRQIGVKAGFIVANHSILPNALLGARLWVRLHEGWQELGQLAFDKQTPRPFNIPPLQTVMLRLAGTLSFPYQDALEQGNLTLTNYLNRFVAQPLEMRLELQQLDQRAESHVVIAPAASNPEPAVKLWSAAA